MTDADLEMAELAEWATEEQAETCLACGDSYNSITFFHAAPPSAHRAEVYECGCGHRAVWLAGKRQS